jgi:LmbE family N-acetylglucosaminyl deacetylase
MEIKNKIIMVLAPHTDDGELGCGATISRLSKDNEIFYVAFSSCQRSLPEGADPNTLKNELKNATKILKIPDDNLILLDYQVRDFPEKRQSILEDMIQLRKDINPDIVFLPSPFDIHQDHKTISEEGVRAFKNSTILGYEMPWNNLTFNTRCFIKITEEDLNLKLDALKEYKSQMKRSYLNKEFIFSMATIRGLQIGEKYAESFEVIRLIL